MLNFLFICLLLLVLNDNMQCATVGGFEAPSTVKAGDSLLLNCSVTFTPEERPNSEISLTKDGQEFYKFSPMNEDFKTISGIERSQMDSVMNIPGWVRLNNANKHFQGNYACIVTTNVNNNPSTQSINKYIYFDSSLGDFRQKINSSQPLNSLSLLSIILLTCLATII
ncbi:uncharacterized protein LOC128959961 isoform X2 [Oppia nitens]|uniref:uncharacterized protein LOC128959961 isoform X2 n=1 Tax=Oppia nitens TaxID=1686743 RepID=UPI0023DC88CC|nr:uncharacterized protein LOC128959961 isoform X2 [Oppia nitens]